MYTYRPTGCTRPAGRAVQTTPGGRLAARSISPPMDAERREAVRRGLAFMATFYEGAGGDDALVMLGEQCIGMFYDVFLTGCDEELCTIAGDHALRLLKRLEALYLQASWSHTTSRQYMEALGLLRYEGLRGWDSSLILKRLDAVTAVLVGGESESSSSGAAAVGATFAYEDLTLPVDKLGDLQLGCLESAALLLQLRRLHHGALHEVIPHRKRHCCCR